MDRGRYYGYRNPVIDQLNRIGNTAERGMDKLGNVPLDIANLNMNRAKLESEITNRAARLELDQNQLHDSAVRSRPR